MRPSPRGHSDLDKCVLPHLALYYSLLPPRCFVFLDGDGFEFPTRETFTSGNFSVYREEIYPSIRDFVDVARKFFLQVSYARFDPINQFGERQTGFIDLCFRCRAKSDICYENRDCPQSFHRHGSRLLEYVGLDKSRGNYFGLNSRGNFSFSFLEILLSRVNLELISRFFVKRKI